MDSSQIPCQLLSGVNQGCPRRQCKDCIEKSVEHIGIPAKQLKSCTQDRMVWHALTKRAFINIKHSRWDWVTSARERRYQLLLQIQLQFPSSVTYALGMCASRVILESHIEAHRWRLYNNWHHIWMSTNHCICIPIQNEGSVMNICNVGGLFVQWYGNDVKCSLSSMCTLFLITWFMSVHICTYIYLMAIRYMTYLFTCQASL